MNLEDFDPLGGRRVEILDFEGNVVGAELRPEALTDELVLELYDKMVTVAGSRSAGPDAATGRPDGDLCTDIGAGSRKYRQCRGLGSRRLAGAVIPGDGGHAVQGRPIEVNLYVLDGK